MADNLKNLRAELKQLGAQHKRWLETQPLLQDRVRRAAAAGMTQAEIVELSHYKRDNVRLLCMPPEKREAMRARRRTSGSENMSVAPEVMAELEKAAASPRVRGRGRPKRKA